MNWDQHQAKMADLDYCWRQFERVQARKERFRLLKKGLIVPDIRCPPTMLVRNDQDDPRYIFGNGKGWSIKMEIVS